jgi:hypothetical protein
MIPASAVSNSTLLILLNTKVSSHLPLMIMAHLALMATIEVVAIIEKMGEDIATTEIPEGMKTGR